MRKTPMTNFLHFVRKWVSFLSWIMELHTEESSVSTIDFRVTTLVKCKKRISSGPNFSHDRQLSQVVVQLLYSQAEVGESLREGLKWTE